MQYLIININALDSDYLDYAILENEAVTVRLSRVSWDIVLQQSRSRKVIVTLPSEQVFLTEVKIPSQNKKQLKQAIPFALEEHLTETLETLHFVSHTTPNSDSSSVAVINQALLQQYITLLRKKKLYGTAFLPDVFLLNHTPQQWTLLIQGQRALLRTGTFSGFSCSTDILPVLLQHACADTSSSQLPKRLTVYSDSVIELTLDEAIETEIHSYEEKVYGKSLFASLPLNLNQGMVTQGGLSKHIHWPTWRVAAVSISLCLAAYLGFIGIQNQRLIQENARLQTQAKQIFLTTFKERRNVINPRVEMQTELSKLRQSSGKVDSIYLEILHPLGQLLSKDNNITIKSIRYRDRELTVLLNGTKVSQLEGLKQTMLSSKPMYQIALRSISSGNNKVTATLVIKEKS